MKKVLFFTVLLFVPMLTYSYADTVDVKVTILSETILSNKKIVIAPASVSHAYTGQGDEMDRCLIDRSEILQDEIVLHLRKAFAGKGRHAEILAAPPDEIRNNVNAIMKKATSGNQSSASPTGKMDEQQYPAVMSKLSAAYQGLVVIPKVIARSTTWTRGGLFSFSKAPKVEWDGVLRKPDTMGAKWSRFLGGAGSGGPPDETGGSLGVIRAITKVAQATKEANEGGKIDVYSLHVEIFNASGLIFSSNGGFDTRQLIDSKGKLVERENLCKGLFDERNKDNMVEAIQVAFEPLFADKLVIVNPKKAEILNDKQENKTSIQERRYKKRFKNTTDDKSNVDNQEKAEIPNDKQESKTSIQEVRYKKGFKNATDDKLGVDSQEKAEIIKDKQESETSIQEVRYKKGFKNTTDDKSGVDNQGKVIDTKTLKVKVLSGDGKMLSSRTMVKRLIKMGYRVSKIDKAPRSNFYINTVYYAANYQKEAEQMAAQLGGNTISKPLTWKSAFHIIVVTGR